MPLDELISPSPANALNARWMDLIARMWFRKSCFLCIVLHDGGRERMFRHLFLYAGMPRLLIRLLAVSARKAGSFVSFKETKITNAPELPVRHGVSFGLSRGYGVRTKIIRCERETTLDIDCGKVFTGSDTHYIARHIASSNRNTDPVFW